MRRFMVMMALLVLAIVPAYCITQITVEPDGKPISAANAAVVKEGIAATERPRRLIEQYFAEHGCFPVTNAQAGLEKPASYSQGALKRATVGRHGRLELIFDQHSGRYDGQVLMTPEFRNERVGMVWHVQTNNLKGLERYLPGCSYTRRR